MSAGDGIEEYETRPAEKSRGGRRLGLVGIVLLLPIAYLFVYPMLIIAIGDNPPGRLKDCVDASVAPLLQLCDTIPPYGMYIDFIREFITSFTDEVDYH